MSGYFQSLPFVLEMSDTVVSEAEYHKWLRKGRRPPRPIKDITTDERDAILYARAWVGAKCDALPWPLSFVHFDHAVEAGPEQAIKTLQQVIGAKDDGLWGAETQERFGIECHDLHALFERMLWARLEYYYVLAFMHPTDYGRRMVGWARRVIKLRKKALELW